MDQHRLVGTIKSFNEATGYGFIDCPAVANQFGHDVFLHHAQLGGYGVGQQVSFVINLNKQLKPQAFDLGPPAAGPGKAAGKGAPGKLAMKGPAGPRPVMAMARPAGGMLGKGGPDRGKGMLAPGKGGASSGPGNAVASGWSASSYTPAGVRVKYCGTGAAGAGAGYGANGDSGATSYVASYASPMLGKGKGKGKTLAPQFPKGGPGKGVKFTGTGPEMPGITDQRWSGFIKSFNPTKGFGFIACDDLMASFGHDVFLHHLQAAGLEVGQAVNFAVFLNKDNKPQAKDVYAEGAEELDAKRRRLE